MSKDHPPKPSSRQEIDAFLGKLGATPQARSTAERGRLLFALDATASRESTWDRASHLQAEMFEVAAAQGGLDIQLCYYRGYSEFQTSPWTTRADALLTRMTAVSCLGGFTQIGKVLNHALSETRRHRINAVVFVGDCMEENIDPLCQVAGELGLMQVPVFLFHEGREAVAANAFRQIARLSGGAYCAFDAGSAAQLRELLRAVAVYASGGRKALQNFQRQRGGALSGGLIRQLQKPGA